jgi:hypothetical protein
LKSRLVAVEELSDADRRSMRRLLERQFLGVTRSTFDADLAAKTAAILLLDTDDEIAGFSTVLVREATVAQEEVVLVFSGDTVVDPAARQSALLARSWIGGVRALVGTTPRRVVWLLICSGFRTYRFLPVFWRDYWPRWDRETPPQIGREIDELASTLFGDGWNRADGVVRLRAPQILREDSALISEGRLRDPDIAFFLSRNPGWKRGDELVCLAEISEANLTHAGRRAWGP